MDVLYLLIPLSLLIVGGVAWAFLWSIRSGQFDDLEGPAHEIIMDDDDHVAQEKAKNSSNKTE